MDDEERRVEALTRELSPHEIQRFLDDRVTNKECPACGSDSWNIQLDSDDKYVFRGSFPDMSLGSFVPVVHVNCEHCGLIRSFDREVIAKWRGDL